MEICPIFTKPRKYSIYYKLSEKNMMKVVHILFIMYNFYCGNTQDLCITDDY